MSDRYLGQYPVDADETPFAGFGPVEWAMYFIERYGGIDGEHHKAWVLDQVARALKGTPVVIEQARWEGGLEEYRIVTGKPSEGYRAWVAEMKNGDEGPDTYDYEEGTAP